MASVVTNSYTPSPLIVGDYPIIAEPEIIILGQVLARGAVLGRITVSGKLTLSLAAAVDGSEVPMGILEEAVDATAVDMNAPVYKSGQFNADVTVLTYGTGHTEATVKAAFEGTPLFVRKPV